MTQLVDIAQALSSPFAIEDIGLLPKGKFERDGKTLCMAMPYADPRAYQDRLNTLAPGEWSTPAPLALTVGDKLVCYVTVIVCGIAHTDVGEAVPGENQGTEAWAQAFKRACSQFGLGRYLYDLDKSWVPYDPQRKRIDLDETGIQNVVRQMYFKAGIAAQPSVTPPQRPIQAHQNGTSTNTTQPTQSTPAPSGDDLSAIMDEVKALGLASDVNEWQSFKINVLGEHITNKQLGAHHLALLRGTIEAHKRGMPQSA